MSEQYDDIRSMIKSKSDRTHSKNTSEEDLRFKQLMKANFEEKSEEKEEKSEEKEPKTDSEPPKSDPEEAQDDEPAPDMPENEDFGGEIDYSELGEVLAEIAETLGEEVAQEILDIMAEHIDDEALDEVTEAKEEAESTSEEANNAPEEAKMEPFDGGATVIMGVEGADEPEDEYVSIRECINLRKSGNRYSSYNREMSAFKKAANPAGHSEQRSLDEEEQAVLDQRENLERSEGSRNRAAQEDRRLEEEKRNERYQANSAQNKYDPAEDPLKTWQEHGSGAQAQTSNTANPGPSDQAQQSLQRWTENVQSTLDSRARQRENEQNNPAQNNPAQNNPAQNNPAQNSSDQTKKEVDPKQAGKDARAAEKQKILQEQSDAWNKQYGAGQQAAANQPRAGAGGGNNYYSLFGPKLNGQPGLLSKLAQAYRNWRLNRARVKQAGQPAAAAASPAPAPAAASPAPAPAAGTQTTS